MWPEQSTHCTSYRVLNYVLRLLFEKQWQTAKSVCLFHAFWFDAISLRAHFAKILYINIHRRTNGRKIHLYKRTEEMGLSKKVLQNILFTCKREWEMAAAEADGENSWACSSYSIYLNNCCRNNTYADDVVCTTNPMHFKCSMVTWLTRQKHSHDTTLAFALF